MNEEATARMPGKDPSHRPRKPPVQLNSFAACLDNAFDDKRVTIALISIWFIVCLIGFTWLGIFGSAYMRVGPSPTLTYMGMPIQTLPRYLTVVGFVVISTAINDFASDAIGPWIQNTVMDHKSRTIPYSKFTVIFITQMWSLYCGTMSVASIALVFAQFDLIMIRLIVDLFVNQYTIRRFLTHKSHDPYRYHTEFLNDDETESFDARDCVPDNISLLARAESNSRNSGTNLDTSDRHSGPGCETELEAYHEPGDAADVVPAILDEHDAQLIIQKCTIFLPHFYGLEAPVVDTTQASENKTKTVPPVEPQDSSSNLDDGSRCAQPIVIPASISLQQLRDIVYALQTQWPLIQQTLNICDNRQDELLLLQSVDRLITQVFVWFGAYLFDSDIQSSQADDTEFVDHMPPTHGLALTDMGIKFYLNIFFVLFRLLFLQRHATTVPVGKHAISDCYPFTLEVFHLEAGVDDFHMLGMYNDIPAGCLLEYKHSYSGYYNNVSQCVYRHFPAYKRRMPTSLADMRTEDLSNLALLPALKQIYPEIEFAFEDHHFQREVGTVRVSVLLSQNTCLLKKSKTHSENTTSQSIEQTSSKKHNKQVCKTSDSLQARIAACSAGTSNDQEGDAVEGGRSTAIPDWFWFVIGGDMYLVCVLDAAISKVHAEQAVIDFRQWELQNRMNDEERARRSQERIRLSALEPEDLWYPEIVRLTKLDRERKIREYLAQQALHPVFDVDRANAAAVSENDMDDDGVGSDMEEASIGSDMEVDDTTEGAILGDVTTDDERPETPSYISISVSTLQLVQPVQPAQPEQPAQPAQPEQPAQPAQPEQPAQPAQPEQPAQPAQSEQPAKPVQPAKRPRVRSSGTTATTKSGKPQKLGSYTPVRLAERVLVSERLAKELKQYNDETTQMSERYYQELDDKIAAAQKNAHKAESSRRGNGNGRHTHPHTYPTVTDDLANETAFREHMITEEAFYNKVRISCNMKNLHKLPGAYSEMMKHEFMRPMLKLREKQIGKAHNAYRAKNPLEIIFYGNKQDEKQFGPMFDACWKPIPTTHTDALIGFYKWLNAKAVKPITAGSQLELRRGIQAYVADAPRQLSEICLLIRLNYIDAIEDGGTDAPKMSKLITAFALYVETMVQDVDFKHYACVISGCPTVYVDIDNTIKLKDSKQTQSSALEKLYSDNKHLHSQ
ncbi:hypothetical protein T484DRAFT_1753846 [Baffinella frigidus]|nr:hypothetical protein T484DRAFT_1753846 [Cryptophyta sp. CCMP2293]